MFVAKPMRSKFTALGKRFWIAAGEYLGEQLRTQGSTAQKAVMAWRKAAEVHALLTSAK